MKLELHNRQVIQGVEFDDYSWFFRFSDAESLRAGCLWRLMRNGRLSLTSNDHGQKFGLTQPVDAVLLAAASLTGKEVVSIAWSDETGDLGIILGDDLVLQVLVDSSGYETWELSLEGKRYIAQGGSVFVT